MTYRFGFYLLIAVVALLGMSGLGLFDRGKNGQPQTAVVAAPLGADNSDSGDNGSSDDNGSSGDNGSTDNSDNGNNDNNDNNAAPTATPTATATQQPGAPPQPAAPPAPQPQPQPQPSGPCQFILGFQFLHSQLNGIDGNCVDNEHDDPNGTGDRTQATFNPSTRVQGYMVWQKATNTMRWTDGYRTFTYSSCGLQERLNTQSWAWERNPSIVVGGVVPPGGCGLA